MKKRMKFVREIPTDRITDEVRNLDQFGFTLVFSAESVTIYAEVMDESEDITRAAA